MNAIKIEVDAAHAVSGLLQIPPDASACYVMAHGAGAGMTHPFMAAVADGLGARRIATLRYQFPYMEEGRRTPDRPALAQTAVRAAVATAALVAPALPLFAGGKSFGGRMTSQAEAEAALPEVRGIVFIGFPLHLPKQPSDVRARHLTEVQVPMLFLQGDRDALAEAQLLSSVVERLGTRATLKLITYADHGFHVPAKSGRTGEQALAQLLDFFAEWTALVLRRAADEQAHSAVPIAGTSA